MAKLPKYICMKVSIEDDLTVCLDPVEPEEVAADLRPVDEKYISLKAAKWQLYKEFITEKEICCRAFKALNAAVSIAREEKNETRSTKV